MARILVPNDDDTHGWFDPDKVREEFTESFSWDGENRRGTCSDMQVNRAELMLTASGRWVLHEDRRPEFNGPDRWQWIDDAQAQAWLMKSAAGSGPDAETCAEGVERLWPDTEEESGPDKGGRPRIGPTINVAYPEELLRRIDDAAAERDMTRAAFLRQIATDAVG